jgi:hypothetical protein
MLLSKGSSRSSSTSRRFSTPSAFSDSHSVPISERSRSSKITESDFSSEIKDIAIAAKAYIRTATIYQDTFPSSQGTGRLQFAWNSIAEVTKNSENTQWVSALNRLKNNPTQKKNLITFVRLLIFLLTILIFSWMKTLYGRNALISNIITKAREKVKSFYNFGNDVSKVKHSVEWLIQDVRFMFGKVDIEVCFILFL